MNSSASKNDILVLVFITSLVPARAFAGHRANTAISKPRKKSLENNISKELGQLTVHHGILERVDSVSHDQCYEIVSWELGEDEYCTRPGVRPQLTL